jgi:beta-lactam-binding protein with PASTA domain
VADTAPLPAAAPVVRTGTVPNVVGIDLQLAQDTLQAAGFYVLRSHDATGQGRLQVLDRNWTVVDQTPSGGTVMLLSEVVDLGAVKDEEL